MIQGALFYREDQLALGSGRGRGKLRLVFGWASKKTSKKPCFTERKIQVSAQVQKENKDNKKKKGRRRNEQEENGARRAGKLSVESCSSPRAKKKKASTP